MFNPHRSDPAGALEAPLLVSNVLDQWDTAPVLETLAWPALIERVKSPDIRVDRFGPGFVPAVFGGQVNDRGGLRHDANVLSIHAIVLDLDGKDAKYTAEDLQKRLAGFRFAAHTTHRNTRNAPRWRVIIPVATPISPAQLPSAFDAVEAETGLRTDPRARNSSRFYFWPSCHPSRVGDYQSLHDSEPAPWSAPSCVPPEAHPSRPFEGGSHARSGSEPRYEYSYLGSPQSGGKDQLDRALRNTDVGIALCTSMGIGTNGLLETGRISVRSILPGHTDKRKSGGLIVGDDGQVWYRDFSGHFGTEWYNLPTLRATIAYRHAAKLSAPEYWMWAARLLYEGGFVKLPEISMPTLPEDATADERAVYDGFKLLLGLRAVIGGDDFIKATAFSRRFGAAWCGISERRVEAAKDALLKRGILHVAGKTPGRRPCWLYSPDPAQKRQKKPKKTWVGWKPGYRRYAPAAVLANPEATPEDRVKAAASLLRRRKEDISLDSVLRESGLSEAEARATNLQWQWGEFPQRE